MAEGIESVTVLTRGEDVFKARWGTTVYDYKLNSTPTDFQDLMVCGSLNRATAVEGEGEPLSTRMRKRNNDLEQLGSLLAIFTQAQSKFASDASGGDTVRVDGITSEMIEMGCEAYRRKGGIPSTNINWWNDDWTKASIEGMVSILKSMMDERNNDSQMDMSRLQSLVDRRDESYTTASNLMSSVSETRDNAIRNL